MLGAENGTPNSVSSDWSHRSSVVLKGPVGKDGLYHLNNLLSTSVTSKPSPLNSATTSSDCHSITSSNSAPLKIMCNKLSSFPSVNTATALSNSFQLWYARLGHPSADVQKIVLKHCNIPFTNKTTAEFCNSYCLGKTHKLPAHPSTNIVTAPFELVFTDLWGPSPMASSFGFHYYMAFADSFTRFTWL